jgi:HD-GYP domain-containing protein (c-di-GMP phosphodiesterase class II)
MTASDYHSELYQVITQVTAAITNTHLYSLSHPQVDRCINKAYQGLSELLRRKPEITVFLAGDDLVADNRALPSEAPNVTKFISILRENAVERMTFVAGLPKSDLQGLIHDLTSLDTTSLRASPFLKLGKVELRVNNKAQVRPSKKEQVDNTTPTSEAAQEDLQALLASRDINLDELKALYFNIKRRKKIDVRGVDDMIHQFIRGFRRGVSPMGLLASLKSADEYTFTHVVNVCMLTMSQAEALGFRGDHLYQIGVASVLHDAGKLFIPEEILNKPAALTPEEWAVIETHPAKGARYILGLQGIPKLAVLGAMEHHIKYNGTGYPKMKGKWKPNIVSQMIAISDVFDAMRSKRPYRGPKPQEEILRVLQDEKGKSFNPQLVENFLKLIKENGKTAC